MTFRTDFERIIRKCLEKDRERRYQSASEMVVDLENLKRDSQSGVTVATVTKERSRWRLKRLALVAIALVVVLGIAGLYLFRRNDTAKEHLTPGLGSIAVLPFVNSNGDQSRDYLSDGITESLINSLSQLPRLRVMARATVFRYKGKEADPGKVGRELNVDAVLTGRVCSRLTT
jgi:eukaryotic-like serine/threonine-protein kinase